MHEIKRAVSLFFLIAILIISTGCEIIIVHDDYSLDSIDGNISCEYRIGIDAMWSEECVESDVNFEKDKFLELFKEYSQYDAITGTKDPLECDYMKINIDLQNDTWQEIRKSEFNVRAVFEGGQRNVSLYRYGGKLFFHVLSMGDSRSLEMEGEYFIELPEDMCSYWQTIIEKVEKGM